ncbi:MAG TPA: hypothetical protein VK324_00250, partial [Tepidisphaeraceae bacterium]|nr:hypothetical protein [Tepidisphaeraceae bacterium]
AYWRRYGPRSGGWGAGHVLTFARRYFRYRTVRKVDGTGLDDPRVRYARRDAADGTPARLRAYARGQGVKVHDVLQAALIEACAAHVPMQRRRPWRRDVAAGAILDLRPHRPAVTDAAFGALLGFGAVACRPDDVRDWPRLLRSVARQNAVHKRGGVPQASLAWLLAARAAARFVPPPRLAHFYRKELPLAGGLSNVDLSRSWAAAYAPAVVLDYARVSPTGPIAPVAVAATTFAGRLGLGITHRAATIDAGRADALLRTMLGRIELLVASR